MKLNFLNVIVGLYSSNTGSGLIRYPLNTMLILLILIHFKAFTQTRDASTKWYNQLPDCPCRDPDFKGVKLNDGWAKDKGNLTKYHRGAATSFRSYPAVTTPAGNSCQQCCYDQNGNLITAGRGAGTPDKVSACSGEDNNGVMKVRLIGLFGHLLKDVIPWNRYMKQGDNGWQKYNAIWVPNDGNLCKINIK